MPIFLRNFRQKSLLNKVFYTLVTCLYCIVSLSAQAQSNEYFIIENVIVEGNLKTDDIIIFNELDLLPGDTVYLSEFSIRKTYNEKRLYSTALFTDVAINIKNWNVEESIGDIHITLQENWYIYPSLIFELADRNFSVWWSDQKRDFSRVNYGLGLEHINLTGHKDKLKLKFQQGYTHKYEIKYNYPYISNNWGMFGEIFYSNQKEIGYITDQNKTLFQKHDDERVLLQRFRTGMGINYRQNVFQFHNIKIEYHHNQIDKYVATELNPDYFLDGKDGIQFFSLKYDFTYDHRLFNLYPEGGYMLFGNITKEGIGIFGDFDNLSISGGFEKHFMLNKNWTFGGRFKAKTNLFRRKIAFANNTGLGYGNDLVRGYQSYVIDGTDWVILKTSLRYKLLDKNHNWGKAMALKQFKKMNIRLYIRANLDFGYVNEPTYTATNTLNNKPLIGFGPAVDVLLFHTYKLSFEYSFNHLGQAGWDLRSAFNF
ncbi:MAG: hypothetical protein V3V14_11380 [Saprospiraceae bacterium]